MTCIYCGINIDDMASTMEEMLAVLKEVAPRNERCPFCGRECLMNNYHDSDCQLAAVIAKAEELVG